MSRPTVEFRCPECGEGVADPLSKREVRCAGCKKTWKCRETHLAFVLVRRFISKLDYAHYCGLEAGTPETGKP